MSVICLIFALASSALKTPMLHYFLHLKLEPRMFELKYTFFLIESYYKSHFFAKPESSSATRPSSSSPLLGPADGRLKLFGDPYKSHFLAKPESSSATRPSSSLPPSGPADGWSDVKQPLPSIPEEPSPVSSPDHAPTSPDNVLNELWLHIFGDPGDHFAKPESSSPQPLPSIPEEPSPVSSPDHAPPSPGSLTESGYDSELIKGVAPPGPSDQASSTMSSADHELMGAHALPNPGPSTESDHEMMDVPLSSPVSSTNPDSQSMDADSPSGKRRKTEKGLWFATRD
ncbi:hypothetical protein V8E52_010772 [Russula decolorans]